MLLEEENSSNKITQRNGLLDYINYPEFSIWKRVGLFAVGNVLTLSIVSVFLILILKISNFPDVENATNFIAYAVIFVALSSICFVDIPKLKPLLKRWEPYVVGVGLGLAVINFDNAYLNLINLFYPGPVSGNEQAVRNVIDAFPIASIFMFGIVGPLCEELTYRTGLFGLLRKWHRIPSYIITSLVFGFIHFQYQSTDILREFLYLPSYILPGFLFSLAYDLYGFPCSSIAHITNNLYSITGYIIVKYLQL